MTTYRIIDKATGNRINFVKVADSETAKDTQEERDKKRLEQAIRLQTGWLQSHLRGENLVIVACGEQGNILR